MAFEVLREHKWQLPEIVFIIAGCFAMGAIGFFIAVFLQTRVQGAGAYSSPQQVPVAVKEKVMERVSGTAEAPRNQADETDPDATAKLRLMKKVDSAQ